MPQASQPLLYEVPHNGSPPEHSEGGNPAFSDKMCLSRLAIRAKREWQPGLEKKCVSRCLLFLNLFLYLATLEF